jgi:hypothetical protein
MAVAFVAVWAIVAVIGGWFQGPRSGAPAVAAAPEPLATEQIVSRVADKDASSDLISWLGDPPEPGPAPEQIASARPMPPPPEPDEPDVRGFEPIGSAGTNRGFQDTDAVEPAAAPPPVDQPAPGRPHPVDRKAIGDVIERLKRSKDTGLLKPEIPEQMTAFETQRVRVILARQAEAVALVTAPGADLKNASELPVRDFVSVELYGGRDFKVDAIAEDASVRSLKGSDWAEWEFDVTPTSGGAHNLEIIVLLYDEPAFVPVAKFSQTVTVDVPFGSRLKLLWSSYGGDWIVNLVLAPLIGAVFAFYIKDWLLSRRQAAAGSRPPGDSAGNPPPGINPG